MIGWKSWKNISKSGDAPENEVLYDVIQGFRELDKIAYKLGFLSKGQSYANQLVLVANDFGTWHLFIG